MVNHNHRNKVEEEKGIEMADGRYVMNALGFPHNEATENELLKCLEASTSFESSNLIRLELKRILNKNVTNGFVVRSGKKYVIIPSFGNDYQVDGDDPLDLSVVDVTEPSPLIDITTSTEGKIQISLTPQKAAVAESVEECHSITSGSLKTAITIETTPAPIPLCSSSQALTRRRTVTSMTDIRRTERTPKRKPVCYLRECRKYCLNFMLQSTENYVQIFRFAL